MDHFAEAPTIYAESDRFSEPLEAYEKLQLSLDLIDRCRRQDENFQQFFRSFKDASPGALYSPALSRQHILAEDPRLGKLFPVAFHFPSLRQAHATMWFWASSLMTRSGLCSLYGVVKEVMAEKRAEDVCPCQRCTNENADSCPIYARLQALPPLDDDFRDCLTLGWNVCQSFEYCMQDCMLGLGPTYIAAPLNIVREIVKDFCPEDHTRELAWLNAAMERIRDRGIQYLGYE